MKFITALIATAAAVKQDETQMDAELQMMLPTLTDAA
jgi:hypothetical protein